MRATPLILTAAVLSTACFQYMPVDPSAPLPEAGDEVRIQLESPQALDLGSITINDVNRVAGHVRQSEGDTLSLFSSDLRTAYGFRQRTDGAVFYFDRSELRTLEKRELSTWKTGLAAGTAVVGALTFWYFAADLGGGSSSGNPTPPPPSFGRLIPIPLNGLLPLLVP